MKVLILSFICLSMSASAEVTEIFDIWSPEKADENYLVLDVDGKVHEVEASNTNLVNELTKAKDNYELVEFGFDNVKNFSEEEGRKTINAVSVVSDYYEEEEFESSLDSKFMAPGPMTGYTPSLINTLEDAKSYFQTMRQRSRKRSQCYNRAHVWGYELWKKYNIKSTKIWMFFTQRYIREYRYHWWFHVTPAVRVGGQSEIMTMDRRYFSSPAPLTQWKNFFMKNNAYCPMISSYQQYYRNQQSHYCYHIESNMYFWQPFQIENLETRGDEVKETYLDGELSIAYRNGFGIRGMGDSTPAPRRRWWRWGRN